ncbi:MAG: SDR family NAD(P)-dependent oxidoreductase, partial [Chloroflexi bacterium]|nr:SDR family NAD(P)-dependent oxidoreductase [Chloroflexota bacterium]
MPLQNKIAIITGAGRGIGRAIALGFAQKGARLTLAARTVNELDVVANEVRA